MSKLPFKTFSSSSPESNDAFNDWFAQTHPETLSDDDIPEHDEHNDRDE